MVRGNARISNSFPFARIFTWQRLTTKKLRVMPPMQIIPRPHFAIRSGAKKVNLGRIPHMKKERRAQAIHELAFHIQTSMRAVLVACAGERLKCSLTERFPPSSVGSKFVTGSPATVPMGAG